MSGNRIVTGLPARYEAAKAVVRSLEGKIEGATYYLELNFPESKEKEELLSLLRYDQRQDGV